MKKNLYIIWIVLLLLGCNQLKDDNAAKIKQADSYVVKGQQYIQISIELYIDLIKKGPNSNLKQNLKLKLGNLYLDIGRYSEAIECFKGVESQEAKKKLAISYFKNLQLSDALAEFDRLGKLKDSEYLFYYGQALEKNNLYDKALDVYSSIVKDYPNFSKAKERISAINLSEEILSPQNINDILTNSPKQEDYPNAGACILLVEETFDVFENNTAEYDMHFMVKIFNERGKEEFSEIQIGYDSTFEEVKLDYARTIKPDGTVVSVGDKNIRDVSIYLNYPLYSNARARIISMPEMAEGVIIEYRAKVFHKQLVNKKDFILNYVAQEGEPIKTAKFSVKLPKNRDLAYKIINSEYNKFSAELNPQITSAENKKIFSWHLENIPEIIPEPDMPPMSRINPIVMISTFKQWEDIHKWWYDLYKNKINIDSDIQKKIDELIKDKTSQEDKIKAIYNFCAQDIRYVAVEYGQAGYEPHDAKDIFKNKYGDCKDQAILLIAMLRAIGVNAYPVLIGTYDHLNLNQDFPSIAFNHCIAVMDFQGEWIFMDPTAQTVPFRDLPSMDQDRLVFAVLDDGYKIIPTPVFQSAQNYSQINMKIKINKDESIYVHRNVNAKGSFQHGQRYWLQFTQPELIKEALKGTANGIAPGAHLVNYKIENVDDLDKDILLEYEFEAPEFLTRADKSRLLPQLGGIGIGSVVKEERNYPIEYSTLLEAVTNIEIALPDSLIIKYLPQNIKIDSDWFEFENTYSKKNKLISFYEKYKLKNKLVSQEEYKEYKKLIEDIARRINQNAIFQTK